jgi:hypothetical protein
VHTRVVVAEIKEVPSKLESMLAIIDMARDGLQELVKSGVTIDRTLVDSISKLASAHANLSREALRWSDKLKKQASESSLEDRKRGVLAFIMNLPLGERDQLYKQLVEFEASTSPNLQLKLD